MKKQRNAKSLYTIPYAILMPDLLQGEVPLTFLKAEKTKHDNFDFCSSFFLSCSSCIHCNSKTTVVREFSFSKYFVG